MSQLKSSSTTREVRSVLDSIRRIVRALRVSSRAAEKKVGLSGAQLFVLQKLSESGHAQSINALAECTLTHQSSVSVVIQRLTAKGLVAHRRSKADRRQIELELTPKGRQVIRQAPGAAQDRLIRALKEMLPSQRRRLAILLEELVRDTGITDEFPSLFFEDEAATGRSPRGKGNP